MDAKETIKYLYEHGHIPQNNHYITILNEIERLRGLLGVAICPNVMNGCKDGVLKSPDGDQFPCQWCDMTKEALKEDKQQEKR